MDDVTVGRNFRGSLLSGLVTFGRSLVSRGRYFRGSLLSGGRYFREVVTFEESLPSGDRYFRILKFVVNVKNNMFFNSFYFLKNLE